MLTADLDLGGEPWWVDRLDVRVGEMEGDVSIEVTPSGGGAMPAPPVGRDLRARGQLAVADVAHHAWIAVEVVEILRIVDTEATQCQATGLHEAALCPAPARDQPASASAASCSVATSWPSLKELTLGW